MKTNRLTVFAGFLLAAALAGCGGNAAAPVEEPPVPDEPAETATPVPLPTDTPAPTEDPGPWKRALQVDPVKFAVTVAGFYDETTGITAGYAGEVHYTSDGGKSWPAGANRSACRFGMDILDGQRAWTIGNQGNVRYTRDGGKTWEALADVPTGLSQFISMADEQTGWAASSSRLVATVDGGQTWTPVTLPAELKGIAAIDLRVPGEGYVLDGLGVLYVSGDGGTSWTAKPLGLEGKISAPRDLPMAAVRFLDSRNGVAVVNAVKGDGTLREMRTSDGGDTWVQTFLPEKVGILFLTRDAGYLTIFRGDNSIVVLRYRP